MPSVKRDREFIRADGPNILMIMSDQHRSDWLGCAGARWLKTPNIDRLAARGFRFTKAACNSPVCAPSRSSLASGLRASTVGVLSNDDLYPLDVPTYYQALRAGGYRVGCIGKTDLHKRDHWEGAHGDRPIMYHLGFTEPKETEGKMSAARYAPQAVCPYTRHLVDRGLAQVLKEDYAKRRPVWFSGDSALPLDAYHDYYIGREAIRYLNNVDDEAPWHYFVSFVGPHNPWDAPREYSKRYKASEMPVDRTVSDPMLAKPIKHVNRKNRQSEGLTEQALAGAMLHYSAMISLIDDYVGRFLEVLKERSILDETVIIYCSDHGEMMGDHGLFAKSVFYESALRVPIIISGPAIRTGVSDALVQLSDLAPTILDMAGLNTSFHTQARSLLPLLQGEEMEPRAAQISELRDSRMIFDGRYKFVENDGDRDELYDLQQDPKELENLADKEPGRREKMRSRLRAELG